MLKDKDGKDVVCEVCGAEATSFTQDLQVVSSEDGWPTFKAIARHRYCIKHYQHSKTFSVDFHLMPPSEHDLEVRARIDKIQKEVCKAMFDENGNPRPCVICGQEATAYTHDLKLTGYDEGLFNTKTPRFEAINTEARCDEHMKVFKCFDMEDKEVDYGEASKAIPA